MLICCHFYVLGNLSAIARAPTSSGAPRNRMQLIKWTTTHLSSCVSSSSLPVDPAWVPQQTHPPHAMPLHFTAMCFLTGHLHYFYRAPCTTASPSQHIITKGLNVLPCDTKSQSACVARIRCLHRLHVEQKLVVRCLVWLTVVGIVVVGFFVCIKKVTFVSYSVFLMLPPVLLNGGFSFPRLVTKSWLKLEILLSENSFWGVVAYTFLALLAVMLH